MAVLEKYGLEYESIDVFKNRKAFDEMVAKTQQTLAPCVEINGEMLVDVGGEEVEAYLIQTGLVSPGAVPIPSEI